MKPVVSTRFLRLHLHFEVCENTLWVPEDIQTDSTELFSYFMWSLKEVQEGKKNDVERKSVSSIKFILAFLKNGCFPWPHFSKVFDHVHKFKLVSHSFEVNGAACT